MARPEIGRPLARAGDAWVTEEKWNGWVLHDPGHGPDWLRAMGGAAPDELWSMIVAELERAAVTEVRDLGSLGVSCRVPLLLPLAERRSLRAPPGTTRRRARRRGWSPRTHEPQMWRMATTHQPLALFDWIELCEPVGAVPAGAQGAVIGFPEEGTVAEIEIMAPDLDLMDRIVCATLSQMRRIDSPISIAAHTPSTELC